MRAHLRTRRASKLCDCGQRLLFGKLICQRARQLPAGDDRPTGWKHRSNHRYVGKKSAYLLYSAFKTCQTDAADDIALSEEEDEEQR